MLFELQFFPVNLFITLVTYKCLELNQITEKILIKIRYSKRIGLNKIRSY